MASRRKQLFEELGLLAEPEQQNPYEVLGIHPPFASTVLREDPSGDRLRFIASGVYRALYRVYHPDVPNTGDEKRFKTIDTANSRIGGAAAATLIRWSKVTDADTNFRNSKLLKQHELVTHRAAELVRLNMELGSHPQHFSQLEWAQGVLLRRKNATVLARQYPEGMQITRGQAPPSSATHGPAPNRQSSDFPSFMKRRRWFGLEPGSKIATYLDESGRASILNRDLSFIMDITDPVAGHREYRKRREMPLAYGRALQEKDATDLWSRSADPALILTNVPGPEDYYLDSVETELIFFPQSTGPGRRGYRNLTWTLPMEAVGTISDESFFPRVRYNKAIGAMALGSGDPTNKTISYFNMVGIPTQQIVEQDAGYSPLIAPGNSLVLYDTASHMPVVTDTQVIGMIGNGAYA